MRKSVYTFLLAAGTLVLVLFVLRVDPRPLDVQAAGALNLAAVANPTLVPPAADVTYTVTVGNAGTGSAHLRLSDTLPTGFAYVRSSTTVSVDGLASPFSDPTINGATLNWDLYPYPGARSGNIFGLHTFVQDSCNKPGVMSTQLDQTLSLASGGGYVKELFYGIDNNTNGPAQCWIDFVNGAYDRGLNPILRLEGTFGGPYWNKPQADAPGVYTSAARAFASVVAGLPRRDGFTLYIELWNEENLNAEWSGACNAVEYAQFFTQTAAAIHALGDSRIRVLNGGFSPGGDCNYLTYIDQMATVPGALQAIDVWATHPYPGNHPPEYNIHDHTAKWQTNTIDTYQLEIERLQRNGRWGLRVIATEGGADLGNDAFGWEGFPPIDETNRADYISRAFRDYWSYYPELTASTPFELTDPYGNWPAWDWIDHTGWHHAEYDAVRALPKPPAPVSSQVVFQFHIRAGQSPGTYTSDFAAHSDDGSSATLSGAAPVTVSGPTATSTATGSPTPTTSATPTGSPTATGAATATSTATLSRTSTPTFTPSPSATATATRTSTPPGYCSLTVATTIPVGAHPKGIAVDPVTNRVFIGLADSSSIAVVDGNTWQLSATWATDGQGNTNGVAFSQNRVFVTKRNNASVSIVDATNGAFVKNIAVGNAPYGAGASDTRVWVANFSDSTVSTIDPLTGSVLKTTGTTLYPSLLAPFGNRAYLSSWGGGITDIDANGSILHTVSTGEGTFGVAANTFTDRVYVSNRQTNVLATINASGDTQLSTFVETGVPYALAVNPATNHLFIVLAGSNQVRVRSTAMDWVADLPVGVQGDDGGDSIAILGSTVYVANNSAGTVTVITDCSGATPTPTATSTSAATHTPTAIKTSTSTPTSQPSATPDLLPYHIYLPMVGYNSGFWRWAEQEGRYGRADLMPVYPTPMPRTMGLPRAVAFDVAKALEVFTEPGALVVRDRNGVEQRASLDGEIRALAIDEARGEILATDATAGSLHVFTEAGLTQVAEIAGLDHPSGVAVGSGVVYVAETNADRVALIDLSTRSILRRVPVGPAPYAVVYNAANGRVYVGQAGGSTVTVLDANGEVTATIELGGLGLVQGLAVNETTNRIFAIYFIGPRFHAVAEIDGATDRVTARLGGDYDFPLVEAYGVAVDPAHNRIFVDDHGGVVQIDGATHAITRVPGTAAGRGYAFGMTFDRSAGALLLGDILARPLSVGRAP